MTDYQFSRFPRLLLLSCSLAAVALAAPPHTALLKEAAALAKAGNPAAALAKLEEAEIFRPDYPRIQLNLARFYADLGRPNDALTALQRLVDTGTAFNLADPKFSSLQELPRFKEIAAQQEALAKPVGKASATTATGVTGILESILIDPETGTWYFGDVRNRCVWRREADGSLHRFTWPDDNLDGVFKLVLSADRQTLWAATATVGVMAGAPTADGSRSALVAIDFATGRVRSRHPVPADSRMHLLGDFVVAPDGALLATDSLSPVIWRLSPGGSAPEVWLESDDFLNLQGLAFSADGRSLFVADYSNGLWRIDAATKAAALLVPPANATFFGIDGLYSTADGLLAVQNGVNPQRVLSIAPAPGTEVSSARVLARAHPAMTDLSLGTVACGSFHFVADSGWALFDPPPTGPAARSVTVYSFAIE